jgi:hypothetical protein
MVWTAKHADWLHSSGTTISTSCGKSAHVIRFNYQISDLETMSAWARHFRNHYCDDAHIEYLRKDTPYSKKDYLLNIKFPAEAPFERHEKTGPATRSGDFAEILVADYISAKMSYWVPRVRYEMKINRNTSEQGSDVIGILFDTHGIAQNDELLVVEVKATLSQTKGTNRLQDAIDHSDKDEYRLGESLNAMKQRLFYKSQLADAEKVGRFQNIDDRPYIMKYGAAAVLTDNAVDLSTLSQSSSVRHKYANKLNLFVIVGADMMKLAHLLYERAADEA